MTSHNYDVAIVGGGAAGLSAALVLARSLRDVVIVDAGKPRNAPAEHMHNFLSRRYATVGDAGGGANRSARLRGGDRLRDRRALGDHLDWLRRGAGQRRH